jgi:DNA-binding NtrC family response regulator
LPGLLVTHGHHFGVRFELLQQTTLGRSSACTIQLLDEKVSRLHSTVWREGDRWCVRDEGSSNGTGVNGRLLLEPHTLSPGDEVAVGNNLLLFEPSLDILRDLEGAGSVVLAPPAPPTHVPPAAARPRLEAFRMDALVAGVSEMLAGPRGVGRPAALLEAVVKGLGAERGALLLAPTGGEPMKAVATFPHRGRVTVLTSVVEKAMERRTPVLTAEGTVDLAVRGGRSTIDARVGACLAVPISRGGRLRAIFYADGGSPDVFLGVPVDMTAHVVALAFSPLLSGDPRDYIPPRAEPTVNPPVAQSPTMARVLDDCRAVADAGGPALVVGEPGTGRTHFARFLHRQSPRAAGPFVRVDCGALPEATGESLLFGYEKGAFPGADDAQTGTIELADGGTVFLDEVAELPTTLQVKLLRMLQEGRFYRVGGTRPVRVDVRALGATARDLKQMVREGTFRADLLEHLGAHTLELPPLRRRLADVDALVRRFVAAWDLDHGQKTRGLSPEAIGLLEAQDWPGNVAELRLVVERTLTVAVGEQIEAAEVQAVLNGMAGAGGRGKGPSSEAMRALQRQILSRALQRTRGHRSRAARMLGVDLPQLDALMAEHGVDAYGR